MLNDLRSRTFAIFYLCFFFATFSLAETSPEVIALLEKSAEIDMTFAEKDTVVHYEALLKKAEAYRDLNKNEAGAWILCAHMRANGAKTLGIGSLKPLKIARKELEKAIELDANALDGYAHASLAGLYMQLPPWPISYGSDKKAKRYALAALEINATNLNNNYSYAKFLFKNEKNFELAERYFLKAKTSPHNLERPLWEKNYRNAIEYYLTQIRENDKE